MKEFQIAGGSVPGTQHTKPGQPLWKNNQDAFTFRVTDRAVIAVVADGCGSHPHTEVGSALGVHIVRQAIEEYLDSGRPVTPETAHRMLSFVERRLVRQLRTITWMLGGRMAFIPHLYEHFLFTVLAAVITDETAFVFSYGDGVFAINGEVTVIEEYEGNMPPYPAYRLAPGALPDSALGFRLKACLPSEDVDSLLIGTDGLQHFINAEDHAIPIVGGVVGPLGQFWSDQRFVDNPDMVRRRLAIVNNERVVEGRMKHGPLLDDTTLVVLQSLRKEA